MGVIVRNVSSAETLNTLKIPTRPDGTFYRFEMIADGGWSRCYDDSTEGLMNFLIPSYSTLSASNKLTARIKHAVDVQVRLQARLNMFFMASPRTESEQTTLTSHRNTQPEITEWSCEVPLVLIDAFYRPYTEIPAPFSPISDVAIPPNIWWLKPAESELEYLRSLHEASLIDLHMIMDEVA